MPNDLLSSLQQSAANRTAMVQKLGMVPLSILRGLGRGAFSNSLFIYQAEHTGSKAHTSAGAVSKAKRFAEIGISKGAEYGAHQGRGTAEYGLSIMPAEMVRFFMRYYAEPGQVYLDPFMGQGVQLQVAHLGGLHYYGYDISEEFTNYIDAIVPKVRKRADLTISATRGDSRFPTAVPEGVGDFCFTSPPYWNIEYYGDEAEQLGGGHTYDEFMVGIEAVARAWLPKFKHGAYCVVNVGDFRVDKRFYPYQAHTIAAYERAGWQTHDTWILESIFGGMQRSFAVMRNQQRLVPRNHEYAHVFRAP